MVVSLGPQDLRQGGHSVQLYGADYDSNGQPTQYYLKNSNPNEKGEPQTAEWIMLSEDLEQILRGVTVVEPTAAIK